MTAATYRQAGVNIAAADRWLDGLKPLIRSTYRPGVLPDRGQFAGLFRLPAREFRDPVLVSSTDGVGTKLALAPLAGDHTAIGVDVVAMNTNDVLAYGAQPLFFLDYIAVGRLNPPVMTQLLRGIAQGCRASGCALLGGETAEMPGCYEDGAYDVAGFCVGVVERRRLLDGVLVRAGDAIIGLASSGVHANGFSLVRKAFTQHELKRRMRQLFVPTRIYVKPVLAALSRAPITAIAHVTGGGLRRRLPMLAAKQPALMARWMAGSWPVPDIFRRIQAAGQISRDEMDRTFNMGIGMALACRPRAADALVRRFTRDGVPSWIIGTVERRGS